MRDSEFQPCSTLIQVAGLAYGAFESVSGEVIPGVRLDLRPVDDNPHDPSAIEVWFTGALGSHRLGFVPRDMTNGLRRAFEMGASASGIVHHVGQDVLSVSFTFKIDTPEVFAAIWPPAPENPATRDRMAVYRSFFPGEQVDSVAPKDLDDLVEPVLQSIKADRPDLDEDVEWEEILAAMEMWWALSRDPEADKASAEQKVGGLPYAEDGWNWPVCPCCGLEVVFVAQMRDPVNSDDLVQVFACKDPDMKLCHQWAQEDPKKFSLVRLWRNPSADRLSVISPADLGDVLPGFSVTMIGPGEDAPGGSAIPTGGPGGSLAVQGLEYKGWHCVYRVGKLPGEAGDLLHTDICVVRRGRGQVMAFDDHG